MSRGRKKFGIDEAVGIINDAIAKYISNGGKCGSGQWIASRYYSIGFTIPALAYVYRVEKKKDKALNPWKKCGGNEIIAEAEKTGKLRAYHRMERFERQDDDSVIGIKAVLFHY
jgi:hypothetical protein